MKVESKKKTHSFLFSMIAAGILFIFVVSLFVAKMAPFGNEDKKIIPPEVRLEEIHRTGNVFNILRNDIRIITQKNGIDYAIQLTRLAVDQNIININDCHTILHLIGHQAYYVLGKDINALAEFTDPLCGKGYQHGAEGEIVGASRDVIRDLKLYCEGVRKKFGGGYCYHGVGHEEMALFSDFKQSLLYCDQLTKNPTDDPYECYKGVFSELAFQIQGVDSQTGVALSGQPPVPFVYEHPLDFCSRLSHEYQQACANQLSRIAISYSEDKGVLLRGCTKSIYDIVLQQECVHNIAAIFTQGELNGFDHTTANIPEYLLYLSDALQKSYILGASQEYSAYQASGVPKNWQGFCKRFSSREVRTFCSGQLCAADKKYCY